VRPRVWAVALNLMDHVGSDPTASNYGMAWVAQRTQAEELGVSPSTVNEALQEMYEREWVSTDTRDEKRGTVNYCFPEHLLVPSRSAAERGVRSSERPVRPSRTKSVHEANQEATHVTGSEEKEESVDWESDDWWKEEESKDDFPF